MDIKNNNQILSFKLKEQSYAVFIANVKEIIKCPENMSKYVDNKNLKGIIGYRDGSLPIIDLSQKLNHHDEVTKDEQFIVVFEKEDLLCGFLVDKVEDIQETSEATLEDAPTIGDISEQKIVSMIFKRNNTIVPILDLEKML